MRRNLVQEANDFADHLRTAIDMGAAMDEFVDRLRELEAEESATGDGTAADVYRHVIDMLTGQADW